MVFVKYLCQQVKRKYCIIRRDIIVASNATSFVRKRFVYQLLLLI